jgi:hypothetical protein
MWTHDLCARLERCALRATATTARGSGTSRRGDAPESYLLGFEEAWDGVDQVGEDLETAPHDHNPEDILLTGGMTQGQQEGSGAGCSWQGVLV